MSKSKDAQYKQRGYLLPIVNEPPDNISVCVPIPNDINHIRAFLGQLDMLGYWYSWERNAGKDGTIAASVWRSIATIVRTRIFNNEDCAMTSGCCDPTAITLHQVNPETGRLEISTDGGTTWVQDPQDPGVTGTLLPGAVTGGVASDKCNAAANAKGSVEDWVDEINAKKTAGVSLYDFLVAVALIVVLVFVEAGTGGALSTIILPIIFATAKLVFEMDNAEFSGYWTTGVYDDIVCSFFCALDPDGSLSEAGYGILLLQISLRLPPGTPKQALLAMLKARGRVGCNNMASVGTGTADCSACECQSCDWSDWEIWTGGTLIDQSASFMTVEATFGSGQWNVAVRNPNINACCCNVQIESDTEGQPTVIGYIPCGSENDDQTYIGFAYTGQQANAFALAGTAPFTVTFTGNGLDECV